jgi:hypothetical protein
MRPDITKTVTWLRVGGACAVLALGAAAAQGCGSNGGTDEPPHEAGVITGDLDGTVGAGDGGNDHADTGSDDTSDAGAFVDAGPQCDPEASVTIDCTGRCGPVVDACSGTTKMCGGCAPAPTADGGTTPRVCDLSSNTCVIPKITCTELGAQCGTVRDSCGDFLDCPDTNPKGCPAGEQCNPDTNQCEDCEPVTCADLGYQCGLAWLQCGPNTPANYTDCGGCPAAGDGGAQVCNTVFHNCEPKCKPATAAVICAAAKAKSGVNCGYISDGCGGIVDCDTVTGFGCPNGQSCGVRGIANVCDPAETPDECLALGRTCGSITSSCTKATIQCGNCPVGQVCNANGVCGAPCTAKKCTDYAQFACGTFDDGCGGTLSCGTCPGGICAQATNTCCSNKQCSSDYAGKCGTALPTGCGTATEACGCASGVCTADGGAAPAPAGGKLGECCSPHAASFYTSNNQCGTNLPDGCGHTLNAACGTGQDCVANSMGAPDNAPASGVVGSCCTRTDTCDMSSGTCVQVQDTCRPAGTVYTCNGCGGGMTCNGLTCCTPAPACMGGGGAGAECNDTKSSVPAGCGSSQTCTCAGSLACLCGANHVCGPSDGTGMCTSPLTCNVTYAGQCGTGLSTGIGSTMTCPCGTGKVCNQPTAGSPGTCACNNPTGQPYTCSNVPGGPGQGGDACGTYDDGCGGTLTCPCAGGMACNTSANPNVCCAPATCPTAAVGSACGNVTNGCTTVKCGCPSGTGKENFTCSAGLCACTPDTCRGRTGAQPDRCGGTLQCGG